MAGTDDWTTRTRVIFSFVILAMFVVSWGVSLVDRTYNPPPVLHGLMVIVSGALYGTAVVSAKGRDRDPDGEA